MINDLCMLDVDTAVQQRHYFSRMVGSRRLVFVWVVRRVPVYRPALYDFFVVADGRLWPVVTALDLLDGYRQCMGDCLDGLLRGHVVGSVWREEYVNLERSIVENYGGK